MKIVLFLIFVFCAILVSHVATCPPTPNGPDAQAPTVDGECPEGDEYLEARDLKRGDGGRFESKTSKKSTKRDMASRVRYSPPEVTHTPSRHAMVTRHEADLHDLQPTTHIPTHYVDIPGIEALSYHPVPLPLLLVLDHVMRALHNAAVRYRQHVKHTGRHDNFEGSTLRYFNGLAARFFELTGFSKSWYRKYRRKLVDEGELRALMRQAAGGNGFGGSMSILEARYVLPWVRDVMYKRAQAQKPLYIHELTDMIRKMVDEPMPVGADIDDPKTWAMLCLSQRARTISTHTVRRFLVDNGFRFGRHGRTVHPLKESECYGIVVLF